MKEYPLISVIVPVYNVERYLPRCIESILKQTYTNFELILVDDGTPDRSGIICDRYAERDTRIRVIHKENGGVSTARNAGIDVAKGEWITFVDSDDWISENYIDVLVSLAQEYCTDLVVGTIQWRFLKTRSTPLETKLITIGVTPEEYIIDMVKTQEFLGPVSKLFNLKVIKDNAIRFPVKITIGEDTIFTNRYLKCCRKIYTTGEELYFYNKFNGNSITRKYVAGLQFIQWIDMYFTSYSDVWKAYGMSDECKNRSLSKISYTAYVFHVSRYVKCSSEYNEKDLIKINECFNKWLLDDGWCISKQEKELFNAIVHNKVNEICRILMKRPPLRIRLKQYIKLWAVRILKNKIEHNRDGLVSSDI